ncbi:LOB domain-containing protein 7-like [Juglans microcarpa x Juglans regia]|uniref:LOB domain-containing protein 7-like n=1 Tax=Juglans microcarpa x Juglans regia TaxID=2249226 RepID=UPI001B7E5EF2|nr:LOB domain-containing protein 7-like [Juglans microcarpa x Juglans regia]
MNKETGNMQACASCKHQRRKCDESCELAPYFPASRYREFQNAHRLFGVSNILKILSAVEPSQKEAAAESILIEGNARKKDPVHGCLGIVRSLESQIEFYGKQLDFVTRCLALSREREKLELHQRKQNLDAYISRSSTSTASPLATQLDDYDDDQLDHGFKYLTPLLLPKLHGEYLGGMKNPRSNDKYNYQSTLEEGVDVKPFDIHHLDQMLESYQQDSFVASFRSGPGESSTCPVSKAHGRQPLERVGEGDAQNEVGSSTKGKDDRDF